MAVDMFLKCTKIEGESMDDKHKGEIDVLAWSWGLSNSGTMHTGGGGGGGKADIQDCSITKYVDKASTDLMMKCCDGSHLDEAILTIRKAGTKPLEYLVITMKECIITSLTTGGSGGEDRLTENFTINFAKFEVKYTEQKKDGTAGSPKPIGWNIEANTKL